MLKPFYIQHIAQSLNIPYKYVENTLSLLEYGATVPFISRYRKEMTGSMDEVMILKVVEKKNYFEELDKRKQYIIETIKKADKLTEELQNKIENTLSAEELEDIFLPFKPKRKTRATKAREAGLEPLAIEIFKQEDFDIQAFAKNFINEQVPTIDDALQGARDIIAEMISEDLQARNKIRKLFEKHAIIASKVIKGKEEAGIKYKDYFDWSESLAKIPSHRFLAIARAMNEKIVSIDISIDKNFAIEVLKKQFIKNNTKAAKEVEKAIEDSYQRLIKQSMENEFFNLAKQKADAEAIQVFSQNLRQLLLAPPLGKKRVLAVDPGFRTGCKIVVLDEQGNLLHNTTIYPFNSSQDTIEAIEVAEKLVEQFKIDVIAIGNGTASRETEKFFRKIKFKRDVKIYIVDESGASVYSVSEIAREEFPNFDVTVRGAVSIGRRLLDPLSELVKIDPRSIGVGQYQHDVDQNKLKQSLDNVVISCVNLVGVDLNTASKYLLTYVSGLSDKLAQNIVEYRTQIGRFTSREQLKKVKLMGPKTFEQCAGFLRILDGENPLDATAVHPEAYHIVTKMAQDLGVSVVELIKNKELQQKIDISKYTNSQFGKETLTDIMNELAKPGRDPREDFKNVEFDSSISSIDDVKEGMILKGIVKNVTNFGAFVDIGIKVNGLIHISEMSETFVKNPNDILKVHQHITVKVIGVDKERQRISLSLKGINQQN